MKTLTTQLKKIIHSEPLTYGDIESALENILSGHAAPVQTGAFLCSLAVRTETVDEITAVAEILRKEMVKINGLQNCLDMVGTGGDGYDTINVSTMAAFVCASLGVPIAKHGTKALSSKCGSFDLLETLGIAVPRNPEEAQLLFKAQGITFLFAPNFHPILKQLQIVRRELGIRTIFNFVGPLLNPGECDYQVVGVSSADKAPKLGEVLLRLGRKRVLVVHSYDGLDEVSVSAPTHVYDFAPERNMMHFTLTPKKIFPIKEIQGGSPKTNALLFKKILGGYGTEAQNEFVAINAALGLYAFGKVHDIETGREMAIKELKSGRALNILEKLQAQPNI